ncbi:FAD dependent oxidoreductase [Candidatus Nitrosocosmicus arcticus]|uniref:FAD dependent oxidoreductase n=1 Tax=Candidatus Nitrosocosmicus arcticus TaxID=2035267 RepID=A0A557SW78_9ARCH|nr:FAD dependent oxidoreductase [Candidatus Nitrosocosmicus arcticus]
MYGYDFWKRYCQVNKILFVEDGVIEVANDDKSLSTLSLHLEWGIKNGLDEKEIVMMDEKEISIIEPNLKCKSAILCYKDASVNYGQITQSLATQISRENHQVTFITRSKVLKIKNRTDSSPEIILEYINLFENTKKEIKCDFLINATGSNSINMLDKTKIIHQYSDLFFRGEYWIAPSKYSTLTKHSIYSVPEFQQFPFLDPHWIIRTNGNREVGPNACPVFSPYGYNKIVNTKEFLPKIYKLMKGKNNKINRTLFSREMLNLIYKEGLSSISKKYMINRVKKFLPLIEDRDFKIRGTSGIRSNLIDNGGNFVMNPIFMLRNNMLHILNYNSPGATGAFPISYSIIYKLIQLGILKNDREDGHKDAQVVCFDQKLIEACKYEIGLDFI